VLNGFVTSVDERRRLVTYKEWNDLVQESFEKCYYVPWGKLILAYFGRLLRPESSDPANDSKYTLNSSLVNHRGIYKDVFGSGVGREWSDYQFRPNFPIAMSLAPELFDPQHALGALRMAEKTLHGPLGMKTLDPSDLQYRPNYENSNDSTDRAVAKGLNYHNVTVPFHFLFVG
jgi:glycogen debranching enzyme